jgi:hypothetical protein
MQDFSIWRFYWAALLHFLQHFSKMLRVWDPSLIAAYNNKKRPQPAEAGLWSVIFDLIFLLIAQSL